MVSYSSKNIKTGVLYFFVHFVIELISFAILSTKFAATQVIFTILLFDFLAFAPQGILGRFFETHKKVNIGYIGMAFLAVSVILCSISDALWFNVGIVFLGIGNALLHELGAIDTISRSESKIFASTIFVGGGSFGLCLGKMYKYISDDLRWLLIAVAIGFVLIYIADRLRDKTFYEAEYKYPDFDIVNPAVPAMFILACVLLTTTIRGFVAYTIPTAWCDEIWEICALYIFMGSGKVFGGYACDRWGYRRVGIFTTLCAIPFLILGNDNMIVSVSGIFMFSMTMGISFAMGISVLKESVALAFGLTTIGLILGTYMNYIYRQSLLTNIILICVISVICAVLFALTLKKDVKPSGKDPIK